MLFFDAGVFLRRVSIIPALFVLLSCGNSSQVVETLEESNNTDSKALIVANKQYVTEATLSNPDPKDWLMWRRTRDSWGHSPLEQIDKENVKNLTLAWRHDLEPGTQEGTPLIFNGVMYLSQPNDVVQARDVATGELKWEYRREFPEELKEFVRMAPYTRNGAIYEDLLINSSGDGSVYALELETGKVRWDTQVLDYRVNSARQSAGPIIANGLAISGRSCNPQGGADACVIVAHDAKTGEEKWRRRTMPRAGEPGDESWGDIPEEQRKHVGTWMVPSYDPELNMIYIGTSVTSPAPKIALAGNDKNYLYHNCTLALNADTGEIVWYYQHLVDHWDFDHPFERVLVDIPITPDEDSVPWVNKASVSGEVRKVLTGIPGKTGIIYTLDRETGEFLWARPTIMQNVVEKVEEDGEVIPNPDSVFTEFGQSRFVCPAAHGGRNWPSSAYNPNSGLMYYPMANTCAEYTAHDGSVGGPLATYSLTMKDQRAPNTENIGSLYAIDSVTGKIAWKIDQNAAYMSLLSTGSGLLFGGDSVGKFRAFDDANGEVLWEVDLGSQVTGYPVTFTTNGKQYIAVPVGAAMIPGVLNGLGNDIKSPSTHHSIFVFELANKGVSDPAQSIVESVAVAVENGKKIAQQAVQMKEGVSPSEAVYMQYCAMCHGATMDGGPAAPALKGPVFDAKWAELSNDELFEKVKLMPPGAADQLTAEQQQMMLDLLIKINNR